MTDREMVDRSALKYILSREATKKLNDVEKDEWQDSREVGDDVDVGKMTRWGGVGINND